MLNCPRCASPNKVKSGMKDGRQRYKCKSCRYLFTVAQKSDTATPDQRRLALTLYLEGLGFQSIGRVMGFSPCGGLSVDQSGWRGSRTHPAPGGQDC